jgi:glycerol-3-phosphate O-acyltransferase
MLLHENPKLDLFGILRLPPDDYLFPLKGVEDVVVQMQTRLIAMAKKEQIKLAPEIYLPVDELIKDGIKRLGVFHTEKPLSFTKDNGIVSSDFRVLYYYHNRLKNYGLERSIHWKKEEIEVLKVE